MMLLTKEKNKNPSGLLNGYIMQTYWDLLEEELKPKGNKLIAILELLSDKSKQGSKSLNDWLSYVYNLVEMCIPKCDSKNRIFRDILIKGCASDKARESIIRKGDKIKLAEVVEILQTEDATCNTYQTLKEFDSTSRQIQLATVHYASYEKSKKPKQNPNSNSSSSSQCFSCGQPFSKDHLSTCRAKDVHCNECGKQGHFQIVYKSLGQFPRIQQRQQKPNSTNRKQAHYISDAPVQSAMGYYNEQGNWVAEPPRTSPPTIQTVHSLSVKTFNSSDKQFPSHTGAVSHANTMEIQPIWQNSTKSSVSHILQVSQQSPKDQNIQGSQNVSVQSFCDTEIDPETHFKVNSIISKKSQVVHFRDVPEFFQRKEEIVLQLPI